MVDLQAAQAALRADAAIWDKAAASTEAPRDRLADLNLTTDDICGIAAFYGMGDAYHSARDALGHLLDQAAINFHSLSGALRHAADLYSAREADNKDRLPEIHGPR